MALERQSIEKKDFPIGRRGYDPEAVDAHLRSVADEVEELKLSAHRRTETLASAAGDQVRAIVEAAESSAAEIQRQAEGEAREIRAEADNEARATREGSNAQAREYVSKVSEATAAMRERLEAMETELAALLESLRTGSNRLDADLQLLARSLAEVHDAAAPRSTPLADAGREPGRPVVAAVPEPVTEPEPVTKPVPAPEPAPADAPAPAPEPAPAAESEDQAPAEAEVVEMPRPQPEPARPAVSGDGGDSDNTEGARLIALNMALSGTSREETDRYLAENFKGLDRARLLDEVYEGLGG